MIKYFKIKLKQFLIYQQIYSLHWFCVERVRGRGIESQPQTWTCFKYIASI